MSDETLYTPKQVAEALGVSDQTIYRWIAAGVLRATPRGLVKKRYLISASELDRARREGNYGDFEGKATPALVSA
jgi:excisionase family DNA binding protein